VPEPAVLSSDAFPAASLQMHEAIWHARKDIEEVLGWAKWASIWLLSLGALAVAYVFFRTYTIWIEVGGLADLFIGGAVFVITAVGVLRSSWKAEKLVQDWEDSVLPFLYSVKFELLPYSGPDREHDIWERYQSIYRNLSKADPKSLTTAWARFFSNSTLKFNDTVKGTKKRLYPFNLYCSIGDTWGLFVRRFEQATPVSKAQIETLKAELEDRRKRFGQSNWVIGVFSSSGFQPEAVEYAQSDEGWIKGDFPLDLIQETATGYRVIWVESD
jgi:hypothetical protein